MNELSVNLKGKCSLSLGFLGTNFSAHPGMDNGTSPLFVASQEGFSNVVQQLCDAKVLVAELWVR